MTGEGARGVAQLGNPSPQTPRPTPPNCSPAHYLWAVLIALIPEVPPLLCPMCGDQMPLIEFVTESTQIGGILGRCRCVRASLIAFRRRALTACMADTDSSNEFVAPSLKQVHRRIQELRIQQTQMESQNKELRSVQLALVSELATLTFTGWHRWSIARSKTNV